jgi:hypothetical protein
MIGFFLAGYAANVLMKKHGHSDAAVVMRLESSFAL